MTDLLQRARELFLEGVAHFEAERLEPAKACFETALALAPGRPSLLANLGATLFRLADWPGAVLRLEAATAADPEQTDAWLALGLSHEKLGHWQVAAQALEQAFAQGAGSGAAWLALGRCQERLGDEAAALRSVEQALRLDDSLADGWGARGSLLHAAKRLDEAATCFERALALGADSALYGYYLASVRGGSAPQLAPRAYVEGLFDQYADQFEDHLVQVLQYRAHEILLQPLVDDRRQFSLVLDLGCGTGLCARMVHKQAGAIDGVDISGAMVAQASSTGLYRRVAHADLVPFLNASSELADLVMAGDVFIYVGALEAVFAAVRPRLRREACFAFSVELHPGPEELKLGPSLRYAHSIAYLARLAKAHGLRVVRQWEASLREDLGVPVPGLYMHLTPAL